MVKLAANISTLFTEWPFLDRIQAAADAGFQAIECQWPYEHPAEAFTERLQRASVQLVLVNALAGDLERGERGIAALPDRRSEFPAAISTGLAYCRRTRCRKLHVMAAILPEGLSRHDAERTLIENLRHAADAAAEEGIDILVEPINDRIDLPGYFYSTSTDAMRIIEQTGKANVRLQYDIYHMQIMEGDLAPTLERLMPHIGHVQLADHPGRGEPGTGGIDYRRLLDRLDGLGYDGWVGCEYRPVAGTLAGLDWARPYL